MNLGPWGSRVKEILDAPPKKITPGEAVSQWVRDNQQPGSDEDDRAQISEHIATWLRLRLRPEGAIKINVKWHEMTLAWVVTARLRNKDGDTFDVDTLVWAEQVLQLSEDKTTWTALMEYVGCKLLSTAELISVGHLNAAEDALNDAADAYNERKLAEEAEAAMESIKRSSAWGQ